MKFDAIKIEYEGKEYRFEGMIGDTGPFQRIKESGRFYEIGILEKIRELKIKGTYIDIGANIGNHSIYFSKECNCDLLLAYEPCRITYDLYLRNMMNNQVTNFQIGHYAAWSEDCIKTLYWSSPDNLALASLVKEGGTEETTQCIRVDGMLDKLSEVGLIKIDIEGAEDEAVKGCTGILDRDHPVVVVEGQHAYHTLMDYGYKMKFKPTTSDTWIWIYESH